MTSSRPPTEVPPALDLAGVHELLGAIRTNNDVADRFRDDPAASCRAYELPAAVALALRALDFRALLDMGVNPLLLFFAALELGVARDEYYRKVRGASGDG